jgi:hypothetical protein
MIREMVRRGAYHVDRPRRAAIRSRDVTAHFNEINRLASRFFVKIPASAAVARLFARMHGLSWTRSANARGTQNLSIMKGERRARRSNTFAPLDIAGLSHI